MLRRHGSHAISSSLEIQHVYDGTTAVGTIEVRDRIFVAIDNRGVVVGRFYTLKLAVRALPAGGAHE